MARLGACLPPNVYVSALVHSLYLLRPQSRRWRTQSGRCMRTFHVALRAVPRWSPKASREAVITADGFLLDEPFSLQVAVPRLEWALNTCIFEGAQDYLVVHGASVERDGRALTLLGESGAGKSTLCAAMVAAGWRLLSDELTLLVPGTREIVPLARPISLKNDSIDLIAALAPSAVIGPRATTQNKGVIAHVRPPRNSVDSMDVIGQLDRVAFIRYQPGAGVRWEEMSRGAALVGFARQAVNYAVRGRQGFEHVAYLVDNVACGTFTYSSLSDAVSMLARLHAQATA